MTKQREIWIDWLRVVACFMVMVVHSTEPFYLGGDGSLILTRSDAIWASFFDSLVRACVPLFLVVSSYLQFPIHYTTGEFLRRRAVRILIPLAIWSVVYAFAYGEPVSNLKALLLNFNYAAGHLWFVYMLVGIYILMPLLSPWAEKVGKTELQVYLGIWAFTLLIPLLRDWLADSQAIIYGPTGLPNPALYPLWGEASWSPNGTFYYISGFIGYLLLGLYLRRFAGELSWKKTLLISIPAFLGGFAICFLGFLRRVGDTFPVSGTVELAVRWETTWQFCTPGTALMTLAILLLFKKIRCSGGFYSSIVRPLSEAGYGMYLAHMLVLGAVSGLMRGWLGIGGQGCLGIWTTPVEILATALITFPAVALVAVLIRNIPKVGKWIMG